MTKINIESIIQSKIPTLIWGLPGVGKTAAITSAAKALGLPCEVVIASLREPSDFAGLPIIVDGEVRLVAPAWARRLSERPGVLFLICGYAWDKSFDPDDEEMHGRFYRLLCEGGSGLSISKAYHVICQAHKWYADRLAGIKRLNANNARQLAKLHDEVIPEIAFEALGGGE